jgi:hypothetical protein
MTRKTKQPTPKLKHHPPPAAPQPAEAQTALASEIELQRQVNERLLALWNALEHDQEPDGALQVKVAAALTTGLGRVARLLRDQRALTGQAGDGLSGAIAQALDELTTTLGVEP